MSNNEQSSSISGDAVDRLTRSYEKDILSLSCKFNNQCSWEVSQHILDHLWQKSDDENNHSNNNQKILTIATKGDNIIYGCQQCGASIHPGWKGTSLRTNRSSVKLSSQRLRSLRRREQRRKKKSVLAEQRKAKEGQKQPNQGKDIPLNPTQSRIVLLHDSPQIVLGRHHLKISCGRCGLQTLLNGLKKSSKPERILAKEKVSLGSTKKVSEDKKTLPTKETSLDFVQLPPTSKSSRNLSIDTGPKKKKGGKKKSQKSSKLMSFLSSLND